MDVMWLYSLCQCILSAAVVVASVRLCMAASGSGAGSQGATLQPGSVSCCLRLCLGWAGAVGGAAGIPANVLLNQRTPQCLYTCITLVCCPLLVRQFTMFLVMLLTLDGHLRHRLADRYSSAMTRQRALCLVLLCWVASVLSSFSQFIGSDVLDTWRSRATDPDTAGLGLHGNWTTPPPSPRLTSSPPLRYDHGRKVIGKYLPYGGFLSKFYVEDMHNFTYAEIHSSHWGVCAADTVLSPQFLIYVHGTTAFMLPLLCLLLVYLDLLCVRPGKTPLSHADPTKRASRQARSPALSLSLLVLLCLPLHIVHALLLFTSGTNLPAWVHAVAVFLFQLYGLVPPILFTPPGKRVGGERASFPLSVAPLPPPGAAAASGGKSVRAALREAVRAAPWSSAKRSLKAKVFQEV